MATAAFDELLRGILVTLYLTPVLYTLSGAWDKQVEASEGDADNLGQTAPPRTA